MLRHPLAATGLRTLTSPRRWPAVVLNGMAVALGIGCVQLLVSALGGTQAALLALSGAVCASLADTPYTLPRTWYRVSAAAALSLLAVLVVAVLKPHPLALGGGVALIALLAMMTMAWGARAGAVSFAPILAAVFAMALPAGLVPVWQVGLWHAAGAAVYLAWALLASRLLQRRWRVLALASALRATAALLRARADLQAATQRQRGRTKAMRNWVHGEAALADSLQTARDFVFAVADSAAARRDAAVLLRTIDLRDVLLASRLDLDLLGHDDAARWIVGQLGDALRHVSAALDAAADALRDGTPPAPTALTAPITPITPITPTVPTVPTARIAPIVPAVRGVSAVPDVLAVPGAFGGPAVLAVPDVLGAPAVAAVPAAAAVTIDMQTLFSPSPLPADDHRARLLPALQTRLQGLADNASGIHALLQGRPEPLLLTPAQLQRFVAPEGWPLRVLRAQLHWTSPVVRHAVRSALALGCAYCIALASPWASHPHWLVLSVAVVLRGSLEQTLARRNARVLGTLLGCAVVVALGSVQSAALLGGVFLAAVGTAHASVLQRYWLAATAATVMALLQSHMVNPAGGFAVGERVADTVLGALLAWGFSYVLPSWERRSLPAAVAGVIKELGDYATHALRPQGGDAVEQRLARRRAYDALSALASALQRSAAEPRAVRVPVKDVAALLDHGQRLMAHLSLVRLTLSQSSTRDALVAPDVLGVPGVPGAPDAPDMSGTADGPAAPATRGPGVEPVAQALQQAQAELTAILSGTASAAVAAVNPEQLTLLPKGTPADNLLPWLHRRLQVLVRDAQHIHVAATAALAPRH